MTSPTPVGTATVLIRATVDKVKDDITRGIRQGWAAVEKDALAAGRNSGRRWATGFNAGIERGRIAATLDKQFKDAERQAGLSGARAGSRYAAAFNQAAKSTNPPDPNPARPRTPTSRPNEGRADGGGGGGGSPNSSTTDRVKDTVSRHTIRTVLDDQASGVLRRTLSGLQMAIGATTAAIKPMMMGFAAGPAIASIAAISSAVTQLGGALLLVPGLVNAIALPFAALKIGTFGITDAFKAMGAAQQSSAQTAKAVASAQKGVVSAQQGVAAAERGVAAATRNSERARESLNDAIKSSIERLEDLNLQMKGSALDEEDAVIGLERAEERLRNMPSGSTSLDYREAALGVKQARQRLEEVRESNGDLREEVAQANKEGVEGSRAVRDARQAVADATQGEADAAQALTNAQQSLADAVQAVQDAANDGGMDKLAEAMGKLAPSAQKFVREMYALGPQWTELRKVVQERLFAGLGDDIVNMSRLYLPVLQTGLGNLAGTLGGIGQQIVSAFSAPDAIEKFSLVMERVNEMLANMGPGFFALVGVFKNLATVGSEFLPAFGSWFTDGAKKLEQWSLNFDRIRELIVGSFEAAKVLGAGISDIYTIVKDLFAAGVGPGMEILGVFGRVIDSIRNVVDSTEGKAGLDTFFGNARDMVVLLEPALVNVAKLVGELLLGISQVGVDMAPGLVDFIAGLREGLSNLTPAFEFLGPLASEVLSTIGGVLPEIGTAISAVVTALDPLASTFLWLVENVLPPMLWGIEKLAPAFGVVAPYLIGFAAGWKAISWAIGKFTDKEGLLGKIFSKVRGGLGEQTTEQDGKRRSTERVTTAQGEFADAEAETERTTDRVSDAIRRNTDAQAENNRVVDNAPDPVFTPTRDLPGDGDMSVDRRNAARAAREAADAGVFDEDNTPARPRSRVASALSGGVSRGAGLGLGAATIGAGIVSLGGEDGISGAASMVTGTLSAIKEGDFTTALANFGSASDAVESITDGFSQMKDSLSGVTDVAKGTFSQLKNGPSTAKTAIANAGTAVAGMGGNVKNAATAVKNWNIGTKISTGLTKAWALAQGALNIVLRANPIGLIITAIGALVAGLIYAYQNSETFRNIVQAAWEGIQVAIQFAWENVIRPVWDALLAALRALGDFFSWVWNSVIKPAWDALGAGIAWVWDSIIRPAWDALSAALGALGDFFSWVWNSVIKPAWDALGAGISWVWENVISPAFGFITQGLQNLGDFFGKIVDVIKNSWDKVIDIVKVPVRFVVETIYNKGIVPAWNSVAGLIGMDDKKLSPMSLDGFATGGTVTGVMSGYSPGRDDRLIKVGGGEAVMRPEWTRAVGGSRVVDTMNAAARNGGVRGVRRLIDGAPAYATGGTVQSGVTMTSDIQRTMWDAVRTAFPNAVLTSGTRYADVGSGFDNHMGGTALDLGGPMPEIARWIYDMNRSNPVEELIHWPLDGWDNLKKGAPLNYGSATNEGHRDHVHWAMRSLVGSDGKVVSSAGATGAVGGGGNGGLWDSIVGAMRGSASWVLRKAFTPIDKLVETATSDFANKGAFGEIPKRLWEKTRDNVLDFVAGKDGGTTNTGGGGGVPQVAPGTGPVQEQVRNVFAKYGWGEGQQWADTVSLVNGESSWNPLARNPSSGAFGLFQFLGSTKDAYLPDENPNPTIQGEAGRKYIADRYGDPSSAWAFWNAQSPHWYDNGGWLQPGMTLVNNQTGGPEPVFSGAQWDVLKQGLNYGGADAYLAQNLPSLNTALQDLAVDAFKETVIGGLFGEETIGIDGLINKAVDQAVSEARGAEQRQMAMAGGGEQPMQAGIVADTVVFNGMDPQKVGDEVNRAQGAGMTPVNGRYRQP